MSRNHSFSLTFVAAIFAMSSTLSFAADATDETVLTPAAESAETTTSKPINTEESDTAVEAEVTANDRSVETDPNVDMVHESSTTNNGMGGIDVLEEPTDETLQNVFYAFRERFPTLPVDSLSTGPYPGWYEVVTDSRIVYVDENLTRLFQGNVIDLTAGIDLTEARLAGIHMGLINDVGEDNMLVYKAKGDTGRAITVFTDINCGYCRLLHSELDTLLEGGVSVRYLMFPRAGLESDSRVALESVWCADDPQSAMTSAKAGSPIAEKACDTPVEQHVALAQQVGLRGTPLIYLDNGTALPGYREASVILEMINTTEPMRN